jgi:transcriptional regulator with XRE-family HTH domain
MSIDQVNFTGKTGYTGAMMELDVGDRLRNLREMYGLSQRALAKKAGVTNGIISMIEKNRNSPSLATLKKILDAIPISLSEFFTVETNPQLKTFYRKGDLTEIGSAGFSFRQVGGDLSGKAMQILGGRRRRGSR